MYFLKGRLPWQGLPRQANIPQMKLIQQTKKATSLDFLCEGLPRI